MDTEYGLIVSFPDDSETFTLGFEAGMIWQRMESGEDTFSVTAHTENEEVLRRMAEASGLAMTATPADVAGWSEIEFTVAGPLGPKLRLINGGLSTNADYQAKNT